MNVLGVDPSLTGTGLARADGALSTIGGEAIEGDHRLARIHETVLIVARGADLAVVEDLPTHAHGAGKTGMVQGVVRLALIDAGVAYLTVPAATVKKFATNRGNATKADMRVAWLQRTDADVRDDNQVDAAWLRAIGLHLLGAPEFALPQVQTVALRGLQLPAALVPG